MVAFFLFLFFPLYCIANVVTQIAAQDVAYNGKNIVLRGNVLLQHEFGSISCQEAQIILESDTKNFTFDTIMLKGEVFVKLKDESEVRSEKADIDCKTCVGLFESQKPQKVEYTTFFINEKAKVPVKATSQAMKVSMHKESDTAGSSYTIRDVQAIGAVIVEYQNNLPK